MKHFKKKTLNFLLLVLIGTSFFGLKGQVIPRGFTVGQTLLSFDNRQEFQIYYDGLARDSEGYVTIYDSYIDLYSADVGTSIPDFTINKVKFINSNLNVSTQRKGLFITNGYSSVSITECEFTDFHNEAIRIRGGQENVFIDNNYFYTTKDKDPNIHQDAIALTAEVSLVPFVGGDDGVEISNNLMEGEINGIFVIKCKELHIHDNCINAGVTHAIKIDAASGSKLNDEGEFVSTNIIIENNTFNIKLECISFSSAITLESFFKEGKIKAETRGVIIRNNWLNNRIQDHGGPGAIVENNIFDFRGRAADKLAKFNVVGDEMIYRDNKIFLDDPTSVSYGTIRNAFYTRPKAVGFLIENNEVHNENFISDTGADDVNFTVDFIASNIARIRWNETSSFRDYEVEYSDDPNFITSTKEDVNVEPSVPNDEYFDLSINPNETKYFRMRMRRTNGGKDEIEGNAGARLTIKNNRAPVNFSSALTSTNSMKVSWEKASQVDATIGEMFNVDYSTDPDFNTFTTISNSLNSFIEINFNSGESFYVRVRSVLENGGESPNSRVYKFTTQRLCNFTPSAVNSTTKLLHDPFVMTASPFQSIFHEELPCATEYIYEFTRTDDPSLKATLSTDTININFIRLNQATNFGGVNDVFQYEKTYDVRIAKKIDGVTYPFGDAGSVTLPPFPNPPSCKEALVLGKITANTFNRPTTTPRNGVAIYTYKVTDPSLPIEEGVNPVYVVGNPITPRLEMTPNKLGDLFNYDRAYEVEVSYEIPDVMPVSDFGPACQVTTASNPTARISANSSVFSSVTLSPNPFRDNIDIQLGGVENVTVRLLNISGVVLKEVKNVSSSISIGDEVPAGLYFIQLETLDGIEIFQVVKL